MNWDLTRRNKNFLTANFGSYINTECLKMLHKSYQSIKHKKHIKKTINYASQLFKHQKDNL